MFDGFREFGATLSRFTERWVPDAWVICMILTAIALALAILYLWNPPVLALALALAHRTRRAIGIFFV